MSGLPTLSLALPAIVVLGLLEPAHAEIATDGSLGPRIELDGPEFEIGAELGRQAGDNLFHSFDRFSLATGERATFSGPDQIRNVISRVTGGERSDIDGTLGSTIPGADFYFINPAGILFGPNASLDLQGSFHVSTEDEVRFRDGAKFSADLTAGSSFTVARPEAFGFLGGDRGTLRVADSRLQVLPGEAISLVGGEVTIAGGSADIDNPTVGASRGTITVGAVGVEGGQLAIRSGRLDAPERAPTTIADADLHTTGAGGGAIRIEGGRLLIDNSFVFANNNGSSDATRGVEIAADRISLRNGSIVTADALASGNGGQVRVDATRIAIRSGSFFGSDVHAGGNGGSVNVEADRILLIAGDGAGGFTGMGTDVLSGAGQGGETIVRAGDLRVLDGGKIRVSTFDDGNGGSVEVRADTITIDGAGSLIAAEARGFAGNAGEVDVTARDQITISGGGQISGTTFSDGQGGNVSVTAENLVIDGEAAPDDVVTGIFAGAEGAGHAGAIVVSAADELIIVDGGLIRSATFSEGDAGRVTVAGDRVMLLGGGQISSSLLGESTGAGGTVRVMASDTLLIAGANADGFPSGVFASAEGAMASEEEAGDVTVTAGVLSIHDGGVIDSSTFTAGDAGTVEITADELNIRDGAQIASGTEGAGAGGLISVDAGDIRLTNGGNINGSTSSSGRGGAITLSTDNLLVSGASSQFGTSGVVSSTISGESDAGRGGPIRVHAGTVQILDGGQITSISSNGPGDTGPIRITADSILISGRNFTGISGGTNQFSSGNGAPVRVNAGTLELRDGGRIDSSTDGDGDAGSVRVRADDILIVGTHDGDDQIASGIASFSRFAGGDAGAVIMVADTIAIRDGGEVDSSATLEGITGSITLRAENLLLDRARISTSSETSGGGQIKLRASDVTDLHDSEITTSIGGGDDQRTAGNITVGSNILVIDRSQMQAIAPRGFGGRIMIDADSIVVRGGDFDALLDRGDISATGGTPERAGTVAVNAPDINLAGDLIVLQTPLLDAAALLRRPCGARQDVGASSFTAAGRGGLPAGPNAPLRSAYSGAQASSVPAAGRPILHLAGCTGAGDASPG